MDIFSIAFGLMMQFANAQSFSTTTVGRYYEVSAIQRDPVHNKTYSEWSRYDVLGKYDTHPYHFHVEVSEGMPTVAELVALAQSRSDKGITAISAVK